MSRRPAAEEAARRCLLEEAPCPGDACAFWDRDACAIAQLSPAEVEPRLARFLLGLRRTLEDARETPTN